MTTTASNTNATTKLPLINRSITNPVWYYNNELSRSFNLSEHQANYIKHNISKSADFPLTQQSNQSYHLSQLPFSPVSEHRDKYAKNFSAYSKRSNFLRRRDQLQLSNDPMESSSSYNNEYRLKERIISIPKTQNLSQLNYLFREEIPKDLTTLYRTDYPKNSIEVPNQENQKKKIVKFADDKEQSDYNINFQRQLPSRVYLPIPVYKKPKVPFVCDTSYANSYILHPYSRINPMVPKDSNIDFGKCSDEINTTYASDYIKKIRDTSLDRLNIFQNNSCMVYKVPANEGLNDTTGQPFNEYRSHFFEESKHKE